jgi:hypothetical protein
MSPEPIELWTAPRGMRCVLVPFFHRYQVRLMRGHETVKTDLFTDEAAARSAACEWQRLIEAIEPEIR